MKRHTLFAGLALALGASLAPADAAAASCSITEVVGIAFGGYDPLSTYATTSTGHVVYQCTDAIPVAVSLGRGGSSSWTRLLQSGAHQLGYDLYLDAARTIIWGDGTGGSSRHTDASPPAGEPVSVTIYGRITAGQNAHVGSYADDITATIEF